MIHADVGRAAIVRAGKLDAREILDLQKLAYRSEAELLGDFTIPPLRQTLEGILEEFERLAFLKAVNGERIIGSARAELSGAVCLVGKLIVHPDHQGRGLGSRLLAEAEGLFPQAERFQLFTSHKSEANLAFYQARGYRPVERRKVSDALTLVFLEKARA